MPPSARKTKTRARKAPAAEAHEPSDVETPETITTPSRGARKRTRGGADTSTGSAARNTRRKVKDTRAPDREDTDGTEQQDPSDNETEPSAPSEQDIIQSLRVSDKHVNATDDLASELLEGQEHVPGYGKIAGRDWVYIIRKVDINIGRPEAHERPTAVETNAEDKTKAPTPTANFTIDIDLGPDRQVSRLHAIIRYDGDRREWIIVVNGRNGVRVDNNLLRRGTQAYLRNGSVIEIANTQMAFITTATEQNEGPVWDASILRQAQKSSEDDEEDDPRSQYPRNAPQSAARNQLQDKSIYQTDFHGHQHNQHHQQRMHPQAQQTHFPMIPGTPIRGSQPFQRSSPGANYGRGIMMESTETIDYSADSAKDLKPPHSYAQLIGMAILSSSEQALALSNIYKWIMDNFSFYRFNAGGWQNSIRHNLSLNKAFTKIARGTDEPGKGMKWIIEPSELENFVQQGMKGCRRPNPIPGTQSTLASPTSPANRAVLRFKGHEGSTPPLNSYPPVYPVAQEAFTPERGSKQRIDGGRDESNVGLGTERSAVGEFDFAQRTPRNGYTAAANAAGSPPPLYATEGDRAGVFDTPFPLRASQRLAPESTLQRPSHYIQLSSPAPFWKMDGVNSTPIRPYDMSPLKTPWPLKKAEASRTVVMKPETRDVVQDEDGEGDQKVEQLRLDSSPASGSSSPPDERPSTHAIDASPSASRPTTAGAKTVSQVTSSNHNKTASDSATPPLTNGAGSAAEDHFPEMAERVSTPEAEPAPQVLDPPASINGYSRQRDPRSDFRIQPGSVLGHGPNEDAEDDPVDLAKDRFLSISQYHSQKNMGIQAGPYPRGTYARS